MIGVVCQPDERDTVTEFFELFKTPWEFCQAGRRYDAVVCTTGEFPVDASDIVLLYNAGPVFFDAVNKLTVRSRGVGGTITYLGRHIPIYGDLATFPTNPLGVLADEASREPAGFVSEANGRTTLRIGYNLFREVRTLLTQGQPIAKACKPALDWHIALLRDLLTGSGIPVVEIPPVPNGSNFMACLTHDIDHPSLRNHCCDHTMFGFLYRATVGSLVSGCRGRIPLRSMCRNWAAAGQLPLMHLGLARDVWNTFGRYLELEAGLGATYFAIPEKGNVGRLPGGSSPRMRASGYGVTEIKAQLEQVVAAGCEVGLHGIDAWLDGNSARTEREKVTRTAGATENGVRMHWLFFDENSPAVLDQAGFSYDSSVGFNETVGYRAGTAQVYKPFGAANLLELPLHVMDTAMFSKQFMNLDEAAATRCVSEMVASVAELGGALTINWHDRSIAPERLWDGFYVRMLGELKSRGAWFPKAFQAVAWFRQRRSARLETVRGRNGEIKIKASFKASPSLPGLKIRVHQARCGQWGEPATPGSVPFKDITFSADLEMTVAV